MTAQIAAPLFDSEARILSLLGSIGPQEVNLAIDQLLRLDGDSSEPITMFLSCQGAGILEALKVVDTFGLLLSPLTAVGLGLIEGAGSLILAAAHQRILYPSAVVSLAGLWDLPIVHPSSRCGMGLCPESDSKIKLQDQVALLLEELIGRSQGKIPSLFAEPRRRPEFLDAAACLRLGLADAIICGPERTLTLTKLHQTKHATSVSSFPTI